jgi:Winged helix DNA-binding domain
MELAERLTAWTYGRQRIGDPATSVQQALEAVVAVYATHPTAPLALWARSTSFTAAKYRRIDRDGKGLRLPAMRNTVFLVPRKNAARVFTAVRPSEAHARRPLRRQGISIPAYERLAKKILAIAAAPLTTHEIGEASGIKGEQLGTVLRCLRYEGRLINIAGDSLSSSPHRYVATSARQPEGLDSGDPEKALAWLASRYLHAYGPARIEDFAWWAGIPKTKATQAMAAHNTVAIDEELLLLAKHEQGFDKTKPLHNQLALLPKWDAYTMGHAPDGRHRFVDADVQERVYTPIGVGLPGDGNPVVLVDGKVAATWTYTKKEGPGVQPFDRLGPKVRKLVDEKLDAVAALLA